MTIALTGWAHVGIRVHDLDRSRPFYELLGFELTLGPVGSEPVAILEHPCGIEINLVLNAAEGAETNVLMDVDIKHPGFTHVALAVADLEATQRTLVDAGVRISGGPVDFPTGARALFVRDPDGNVFELNQPGAAAS